MILTIKHNDYAKLGNKVMLVGTMKSNPTRANSKSAKGKAHKVNKDKNMTNIKRVAFKVRSTGNKKCPNG